MKRTIYTKLIMGYIIFAVLSLLFISYEYQEDIMEKQVSASALSLYNQANGISSYYSSDHYNLYEEPENYNYRDDIKTFMLPNDTCLWILSTDGKVMYSSVKSDEGLVIGSLTDYFNSDFYTVTDFNGMAGKKVVAVYSPIVNTYKTYGYIILHQKYSSVLGIYQPVSNYVYGIFIFVFVISFSILAVFHIYIYLPLRKVRKAAYEYAKGNFDYDGLKINSKDEIGDIAAKLRFIAGEMKESDNRQKKFITNISHDFRSPLTSIKGYLEAMLDGTIPPEMYEKYLNILLFETERLNKLTGSLLLLNTWDSKAAKLDITEFDLIPLTRNIVSSFEGQCAQKKITVDVVFGDKSYMVNADKVRIQQVIYNLIDNAIKFSHNNSIISINISDKNDKVFVSIKDNGIGIPKENLTKIWDRFYKTDISRGKDKTGTGLGLSIVKEVIASHNENINVISTEGVGTEFIFTLQKSKKNLLPLISS